MIRTFSGAEMSFWPSPPLFRCFSMAKSSKKPLEVLLRLSEKTSEKTFSFFSAFRWRKAAKATRQIPMAASGRLKAASGDFAGLRANRPLCWRFQPPVRFPAIGTKSGITMREKRGYRYRGALPYIILPYIIMPGLILRAPGSAAGRILPRRTTCGGFWYFWPQKYKGKTLFFFSAFRWRKAAKATRQIPMAASGRLKAASGDCSRVCKQTVPSAGAFSRPDAFPPSEPSRGSALREKEAHFCRGNKRGIYPYIRISG